MRKITSVMKKSLIVVLLICLLTPAAVYAKEVRVSIPSFPVVLNGQTMETEYNQYPLLVYKDITYFPMAYNYAGFLKLKTGWYEGARDGSVLFVGITAAPLETLTYYKTDKRNQKTYTAAIPEYRIAVNTVYSGQFIDNAAEEYPLLNFRGVTYFPLTWRFAVDEFGWDYSFDSVNGLRISTGNPFRPVMDDTVIGHHSPDGIGSHPIYFYGSDYYVGYPQSTFFGSFLIVKKRGANEEIRYDLTKALAGADWYFNREAEDNGYGLLKESSGSPSITGNIFTIKCAKQSAGGSQTVELKINLDTGEVTNI